MAGDVKDFGSNQHWFDNVSNDMIADHDPGTKQFCDLQTISGGVGQVAQAVAENQRANIRRLATARQ